MDESRLLLPTLLRRVERLETRLKLIEEEQKGGIDLDEVLRPRRPELAAMMTNRVPERSAVESCLHSGHAQTRRFCRFCKVLATINPTKNVVA